MVADRAKCAKGLVMYHFSSKSQLLAAATGSLGNERVRARIEAVGGNPTQAIDRLWQLMVQEVADGDLALWLGLLGHREMAHQAREAGDGQQRFISAMAATFRLSAGHPLALAVPAMMDGLQLQLLQERPEGVIRELYDGFWLEVLDAAGSR